MVTRGLQQQSPVAFAASSPAATHTITVNENTRCQTFEGGGASITDATAHLFRGGAISAATRSVNGAPTQIWACAGGANQKWTVPA